MFTLFMTLSNILALNATFANCFQIYNSRRDWSTKLKIHLSNYLLNLSTQVSHL